MIPLKDLDHPTRRPPVVTWGIVAINAAVFALTYGDLDAAARSLGAVAYHFTGATPEALVAVDEFGRRVLVEPVPKTGVWPLRALTHMWVHGGFLHLLGNMWFLHVFGDNVEDRLGRARFLGLYLLAGAAALLTQVLMDPVSGLPMVGASGAVAGALGAYLRLFPTARVLTLVPLGFILTTFVWPAFVFLGIWIAMQVANAVLTQGAGGGGVAWYAHIGGFAVGWLLARVLAPPERGRIRVSVGARPFDGDRFGRF
jgi:membrane associated rhomboid family serine protease